ncbi:MAG: rhomboid family intramembrane serine protease [Bacteroidota bacterium]
MELGVDQISLLIVVANLLVTYKGETDPSFKRQYLFNVEAILVRKEYIRMLSSGFLHGGWFHFLINMYCLWTFSGLFHMVGFPAWYYLVIYFGSLIGGNALSLFIHRNNGSYSALGASGAVSGVVFANIALQPYGQFYLFFLIPMVSWLAGILFVAYSIYGIKAQNDNIGHDAHLGGAIIGLLLMLLYVPGLYAKYPIIISALLFPAIIFLYLIVTRPEMLLIPGYWKKEASRVSTNFKVKRGGKKASSKFSSVEDEINYLLDKGYENLSPIEKKRLEQLSRRTDE